MKPVRLLTWLLTSACAAALLAMPARAEEAPAAGTPLTLDQAVEALKQNPAAVDFLLKHPEAVLDALMAERAPGIIAQKRQELLASSDDLVEGNAAGDVAIVEFFDYRCPYCKQIEPLLEAMLHDDKKLRIVYKEFPVLGDASIFAARVALASRRQGKYAEFHRAMMAAKGTIDDDFVLKIAASVGLDIAKIKAEMGAAEIDRIIQANYDLADVLNIQGTPAMIIGMRLIPGAVDLDTLRKDIAAARKGS
jgi:protein-disulfide isomerase